MNMWSQIILKTLFLAAGSILIAEGFFKGEITGIPLVATYALPLIGLIYFIASSFAKTSDKVKNAESTEEAAKESLQALVEENQKVSSNILQDWNELSKKWFEKIEQQESYSKKSYESQEQSLKNIQEELNSIFNEIKEKAEGGLEAQKSGLSEIQEKEVKLLQEFKSMSSQFQNNQQETMEKWEKVNSNISADWNKSLENYTEELTKNSGSLKENVETYFKEVAESLNQNQSTGLDKIWEQQKKFIFEITEVTSSQQSVFKDISFKLAETIEALEAGKEKLNETTNHSQVNQTDLQTSIELLNHSLTGILDRLESKTGDTSEEGNFIERLNSTLEIFHEKASEVLIENSLKTREILSEALNSIQEKSELEESK